LATLNIESFTFDHSGHGESTGELKKSSLKKRVDEATEALKASSLSTPISLCGFSMGGYVSIKLAESLGLENIQNLILFCPGIYNAEAYSVQFDQGFTDILRTKDSWENSDAFQILDKFTGNLLIIIGDQDEVIPEGIADQLYESTSSAKSRELIYLPGCTHSINSWFKNNPEEANRIIQKIASLR